MFESPNSTIVLSAVGPILTGPPQASHANAGSCARGIARAAPRSGSTERAYEASVLPRTVVGFGECEIAATLGTS